MQDYTLGQLEQNSKLRARQLCKTLSQLGPSFVKIGQALSSRPDLLPQIYLEVSAPCFCAKTVGLCSVEHWLLPSASPKCPLHDRVPVVLTEEWLLCLHPQ